MNSGPTIDGRISPQRQLSSPSTNDGIVLSTANEQEVFIDFFPFFLECFMCIIGYGIA
jgi:hypothetical protein